MCVARLCLSSSLSTMNSHLLQLKLFGSPQISYQGQPLTGFVSAKVRALLIYLAVTARPHSRDHLAHLLWEDTPASMKTNLRKALSNLRQLIGDLLVEEGKELITLDPQRCWVDVVAFEHALKSAALTEAAQLYTADFLDGFNPSLSYEFEAWTLREQSRLKSGMVDLLRKLATQQETSHTLPEAIQTVRRLLALEPWQEESHRWLMALLAKDGQRNAALAHFEVCKRVLKEELAVDPASETIALVDKIQRAEIAPAPPAPKQPAHWKPEFPLFGREREWANIQRAWQRTLTGSAHLIALAGEAGIGKTRLTEEARLWVAQQGYVVAYARSYAAEGSLAYSPLVDWLRSDAINAAFAQVEPLWLTEVARLLPELLTTFPQVAPPTPLLDSAQRRLFHEALARVLGAKPQPRLLIIDDLQWCDRDTLEWLRFLLRFEPTQPLLIIGAYRSEEVGRDHPLQKLLLALRREEIVTEIELGMLSMGDTTSLIHAASPVSRSQEQIAQVWRATAGHPLFIVESLRSTNEQGGHSTPSPKIQHVIQTRLAELSPAAHRLAMVAAVVGHGFSLALLGQASKVEDDETLLLLLDELWTRRIILPLDDDHYDFSHDRIREVVYAAVGPIQQRLLHHRVAQALEKLYAANLTPILGELGTHYEQAGQLTPAMHYYQQAATHARAIYSHGDLLHYLNKQLAMLRRLPNNESLVGEEIDLLLDLGLAYIFTDGWGAKSVGETWQQAHDLAFRNGSKFQQARVLLSLDIYFNNLGEMHTARAYSEKNLNFALIHLKDDDFLMQQVFGNYGGSLYHSGEIAKSLPYFNQMLAMHKPESKPSFWWIHRDASTNALVRSAKTLWFLGYPDQARARCDKAAEIARQDFDLFTLTAALDFSGMVYSFCQDYAAVKHLGEEMIALATKYEFPYYWMIGKIYVGWASVLQDDLNAMGKMTEDITEFFAINRTRKFAPQRKAMWAEVLLLDGKAAAAIAVIDEVLQIGEQSGNIYFTAHLLKVKGDCLQALRHDNAEIETVYQQSLDFARKQEAKSLELRAGICLARLWQAQGKHTEAYQLLAPIYTCFTEGFDTLDLIEAKQLLAEVATTIR